MNYLERVNSPRNKRWINAAFATQQFEPSMLIIVQGLGRLDVSLIEDEDSLFERIEKKTCSSFDDSAALNDRITNSYLWVLGGYELIRTICQRIKEKNNGIPIEISNSFEVLKKDFNRLRVPLAKMESASAHKGTDYHIAYPTLDFQKGIAWRVSHDAVITRRELSDKMLETLELARSLNSTTDSVA